MLLLGVGLSFLGFQDLSWMGLRWLTYKAADPWLLNSYIQIPAKISFIYFGVISLWLGGVFAGIATVLILAKYSKSSLIPFFLAIFFTGLGFNTLDWMLSPIYSISTAFSGVFPSWPINLPYNVETWNWYICFGIVPMFLGGFLIAVPLVKVFLDSKT